MPLQRAPRQIFEAWHFTALLIYSRRRRGLEAPATRDLQQGRILQQPLHWTLSTSNQFTRYRPKSTPPPSVCFYPRLVTLVAQWAELELTGACQSRYPPPLPLFTPQAPSNARQTLVPTQPHSRRRHQLHVLFSDVRLSFSSHPNCHYSTSRHLVSSPFHTMSVHRSAASYSITSLDLKNVTLAATHSVRYILHSSNTSR